MQTPKNVSHALGLTHTMNSKRLSPYNCVKRKCKKNESFYSLLATLFSTTINNEKRNKNDSSTV
jgi:hypothetical protein